MTATDHAKLSKSGFRPLVPLLAEIAPAKHARLLSLVDGIDRDELIGRFRASFENGKRNAAHLFADELMRRRIPPCFWHDHLLVPDYNIDQTFDLTVYDFK